MSKGLQDYGLVIEVSLRTSPKYRYDDITVKFQKPKVFTGMILFENYLMLQLSRAVVQNIHLEGGSLLGVSRGGPNTKDIVDSMQVFQFFS